MYFENLRSLHSIRPLEEGDVIGVNKPINCNGLSRENSTLLKNNLKSILPF